MTETTFHKAGIGKLAALGLAAALTIAAVPASALPLGGAGVNRAATAAPALPVENVKCNTGCAAAIGIGAGVVTGAIIANQAQRNRSYDDGYRGGYQGGYDSGPGYYGGRPAYQRSSGYGRCWVEVNPHRGTGYWTQC
ncbi:hypothetical protein FHS55_001752 [Angulomicrobium tetraedrale]|uniref:Uncharacterized protein n=1 Tax=Ancylobacter tetraedralis TaxID=217068 RepID=A0A839Z7M5_9HYPH|nr:hypothetical protein [Ancylobacter tetraedralis]MBB3771153.1 hypothetical protein [Ancylobacter tetraedralis]